MSALRLAINISCIRRALGVAVVASVCATTVVFAQQVDSKSKTRALGQEKANIARLEKEWLNALNRPDVNAILRFCWTGSGFSSFR